MKSTDFGVTWQETGFKAFVVDIVYGADSLTILLGSYWTSTAPVGVFSSTNGGNAWQNPMQGLPDTLNVKSVLLRGSVAYLAGNDGDSSWIFQKTSDTWEQLVVSDSCQISSILILNNLLYSGCGGVAVLDLPSTVIRIPSRSSTYSMGRNFPNPFNSETRIYFEVLKPTSGTLLIYDNIGQVVRHLFSGFSNAGDYQAVWDSRDDNGNLVSSGVYYCTISFGTRVETIRMILTR